MPGTEPEKISVSLKDCYARYAEQVREREEKLKANEEEINKLVASVYGRLDTDESPAGQNVTLRIREPEKELRSLLSYAVGCMFGRFTEKCDKTETGVLLLTAEDILQRLNQFLMNCFGQDTLEENWICLAEAAEGKRRLKDRDGKHPEDAKNAVLTYLRKDFYKEHAGIYQKHPIYWLAESGRRGAFLALIYAHGYSPSVLQALQSALLRTMEQGVGLEKDHQELEDFSRRLQILVKEPPVLDMDDGIRTNRLKLSSILAV